MGESLDIFNLDITRPIKLEIKESILNKFPQEMSSNEKTFLNAYIILNNDQE